MFFRKLVYISFTGSLLASCAAPGGFSPYGQEVYKKGVPVVSASRGTGEYISRETTSYKEYISALEQAKKDTHLKNEPVNLIDEYVLGLQDEQKDSKSTFIQYNEPITPLTFIWGKPAGSVGEGVTLMDSSLRKRFNDALSTTPVGSQAKWGYRGKSFIFMPNSDVYQPYHSGGKCRDGIFVNLNEDGQEEKLRGLFCQKGRGADWHYIR